MGLLSQLGLKPTAAMLGHTGAAPATGAKSPEMATLLTRFQDVMGKIKALEGKQAPETAALKLAAVAAGKLSTSPRGIVQANAALDKVEAQIVDAKQKLAKAEPAQNAKAETGAADGRKLADDAKKRLAELAERGRKAIAADAGNPNEQWLADVVKDFGTQAAALEKDGSDRAVKDFDKQLAWLEQSVVNFEADAKGEARPGDAAVEDVAKLARDFRKRLLAMADRGKKALAADPANPNADWLAGVVSSTEDRIVDLEKRKTRGEADSLSAHFDWFEDGIRNMEAGAERAAREAAAQEPAEAKPKAEDSPALKKVKAQFKQVMSALTRLAADRNPQAAALKKAAVKAGNLATSPKGIEKAARALDMVMSDAIEAKAEAKKASAAADKAKADADKAASETFDLAIGGRTFTGLHREDAMKELRLERGKLDAQLEAGWALHVDQMNLPNEIPFQAWLTSGVDAIKSLVPGRHAAKIPDLNIWDPAREMLNDIKRAERSGDVKAIEALLPKVAAAIPKARSQVGQYKDQMEGAAQSGVDAGRFVEDTAASGIGAIAEKRGGKAGKVAAQAAAQGVFAAVEQLTEWAIGTRRKADPGAIAQKVGEEAIRAVFKEMIAGKLKPLFKNAFGSYLGSSVTDAELKALGIGREAFMTAGQKWFSEFAPKVLAGAIKSSVGKIVYGTMPGSPEAMVETVTHDLFKGSAKQLIVDGIKAIANLATDASK